MDLDIKYLLWLQELRFLTGGVFDEIFNALSKFSVDLLPFLPFIIFWGSDKKWGYRFMITHDFGDLLNGIIKLTVCAYRPWIRSDLIEPAGDSKVAATGYSFPSGHSFAATSMYGTTIVWQKAKRRWLAITCSVLILLTCFSRNFLGVHTPQDVVVAFIESWIVIYLVGYFQKKIGSDCKKLDLLGILGIVFVIATICYISFKSYPMDYVDGKLLVDPHKMMNDCFKACGAFTGLIIGSYVERHYIHYEIPVGAPELPVLTAVGAGLMFAWKELFAPATVTVWFGGHWGNFVARLLMLLFAMIVWPLVIRKVCGNSKQDSE